MSRLSNRCSQCDLQKYFSPAAILLLFLFHAIPAQCQQTDNDQRFVYRSYQRTVYCKASSRIRYPRNAKQLQSIVKQAISRNTTVKVIGSRHSVTDIICTEGIPVSTRNMNYTRLSADGKTVTVGSGAQLQDVLDALLKKGKTIVGTASFGGITIGGALGTGAHGSSLHHPNTLSDQVVGLTIIDGLGQFRKISRRNKDLPAFRVHLGLLGAIVNVTLKTTPSFKMTVLNYPDLETILLDGFALREAALHPWYQVWWFPATKSVVVSKGNYSSPQESEQLPGNARTNLIPDISPVITATARTAMEDSQARKSLQAQLAMEELTKESLYTEVPIKPPIFVEEPVNGTEAFVNPATGYAYRLQTNRCSTGCVWNNGDQSVYIEEFAMAFHIDQFVNVISRMKEILDQMPASFSMIGILIRFSKASDALMSIASGRETFNLEWITPQRLDPYNDPKDRIGSYQALQQALVFEFDGRIHWGKNGPYYFTRQMIRRRPRKLLRKFQNAMRKYDPNGLFLNRFGRRVLSQSRELSVDPQTKHCALLDYCRCGRNEDCGQFQVCTKFEGKYPICKDLIDGGLIPSNPVP